MQRPRPHQRSSSAAAQRQSKRQQPQLNCELSVVDCPAAAAKAICSGSKGKPHTLVSDDRSSWLGTLVAGDDCGAASAAEAPRLLPSSAAALAPCLAAAAGAAGAASSFAAAAAGGASPPELLLGSSSSAFGTGTGASTAGVGAAAASAAGGAALAAAGAAAAGSGAGFGADVGALVALVEEDPAPLCSASVSFGVGPALLPSPASSRAACSLSACLSLPPSVLSPRWLSSRSSAVCKGQELRLGDERLWHRAQPWEVHTHHTWACGTCEAKQHAVQTRRSLAQKPQDLI